MHATIVELDKHAGIAEQVQYDVKVRYENADSQVMRTSFFTAGGAGAPVLVLMSSGEWVRVHAPSRFGDRLDESWIRNFYEDGVAA